MSLTEASTGSKQSESTSGGASSTSPSRSGEGTRGGAGTLFCLHREKSAKDKVLPLGKRCPTGAGKKSLPRCCGARSSPSSKPSRRNPAQDSLPHPPPTLDQVLRVEEAEAVHPVLRDPVPQRVAHILRHRHLPAIDHLEQRGKGESERGQAWIASLVLGQQAAATAAAAPQALVLK